MFPANDATFFENLAHYPTLAYIVFFTGLLVWAIVVGILIFIAGLVSYHALGASIFTFRVVGMLRRGGSTFSLKQKADFWWDQFRGEAGHGSFIHKNTHERVYWPWPWYREAEDRNVFDADEADALEG